MENTTFNFSKLFNIKKFYSSYLSTIANQNDISVGCLVFIKAIASEYFHSQQEISLFIGCNKAHTSRIFTKLLKGGYIKTGSQKDKTNFITLTQKGKNIASKVENKDKEYARKLVENINSNDLEIFKKVCNQIYINSKTLSN